MRIPRRSLWLFLLALLTWPLRGGADTAPSPVGTPAPSFDLANVIIDPQGRIRFMSVLDTANFDARLVRLQATLDALLDGK